MKDAFLDQSSESDVARASRGDEAAVGRVLGRWAPALERYLRRRAGPRILAHESAADLAQSVCREALDRLGRGDLEYCGEAALKQWLYGAADLKVKNRIRYYGAGKRDGSHAGLESDALVDGGPSPSVDAAQHETRDHFERALEQLEPRQAEAVRLFHLDGLDHATVAERLGIEPSHSRTLVARGLARLARLLRED